MESNNKSDLNLIDALPHGAINEIATELQMNPLSISKILKGEWRNDAVTEAAKAKVAAKIIFMQQVLAAC